MKLVIFVLNRESNSTNKLQIHVMLHPLDMDIIDKNHF